MGGAAYLQLLVMGKRRGYLWGSAPTPARFFEKSGGKTFFTAEYPTHSVRALFGGMFSQQIMGLSFSLTATNLSGQI